MRIPITNALGSAGDDGNAVICHQLHKRPAAAGKFLLADHMITVSPDKILAVKI